MASLITHMNNSLITVILTYAASGLLDGKLSKPTSKHEKHK